MTQLRDYEEWHKAYDDPHSTLSWRLRTVQDFIRTAFDSRPGPVRVVSSCAGDGRDVLGVLAERDDVSRFPTTLIELHPALAAHAQSEAETLGPGASVQVRAVDAGSTDAYAGAVPADLVLMVGVFGNISDEHLARTVAAMPQLCAPGASLIWTHGRWQEDRNDRVRQWFDSAGFTETDYATLDRGSRPAVGVVRYDGPGETLRPGSPLFSFVQ